MYVTAIDYMKSSSYPRIRKSH